MNDWIERMSRLVGGLLFQGGYVTSTAMLTGGQRASVADETTRDQRAACEAPCGRTVAAGT